MMHRAIAYCSISAGLLVVSACSSTGGNGALKTISKLLGGQQDQSVFKDTTVKEALEYEYRVCLGDYEGHHDKMKQCVEEAYAKVIEEKGIGERPQDGQVIIRDVSDDEVINDDTINNDTLNEENEQDDDDSDENDN